MRRVAVLLLPVAAVLALAGCGAGANASTDAAVASTSVQWLTSAPDLPSTVPPLPPLPSGEIVGPPASPPPNTAATTQAPPVTTNSAGGCSLPHTGDLIWWEKWPGTAAEVSMLGDIDILKCKYTWDVWADEEPTGPGYCDILARPSDNPGYDMNAVPPARPSNILAEAGGGC